MRKPKTESPSAGLPRGRSSTACVPSDLPATPVRPSPASTIHSSSNKPHEQHNQHHYSFIIIGWAGHQPRPLPQGAQARKRPRPHRLQLNSAWHCVCHRESFSQLMAMPEVCNHCIFQGPSPIFSALQSSQDITKTHKQQQNQNIHHKHIYTRRS